MAQTTLCDYITLLDGTHEHSSRILEFTLPEDYTPGTGIAKPVLMFRVDATETKTLWIHVNDQTITPRASNAEVTLEVTNQGHRTVHELINGDRFRKGPGNKIVINATPDSVRGKLYISDVVLMFQRYIEI
jgi:hypothetical protein